MNISISSIDSDLVDFIEQNEERELSGTVVNIFNNVINIETSHPISLITLANAQVIQAPFMMKVKEESAFAYLRQSVTIGDVIKLNDKGNLSLKDDQLIFRSSTRWQSLIPPMEVNKMKLSDFKNQVNNFLENQENPGGILNAYRMKTTSNDELPRSKSIYDSYFRQLLQQLGEQFDGESLKQFIGLGVGLTPSGDDFIVGILAVLYHYGSEGRSLQEIKNQIRPDYIEGKTTRVSKYMLQFALEGKFNEALLGIFHEKPLTKHSLNRVKSIGSTSGTDMLSGVGFALEHLLKAY